MEKKEGGAVLDRRSAREARGRRRCGDLWLTNRGEKTCWIGACEVKLLKSKREVGR
jgi:hypothetical protein